MLIVAIALVIVLVVYQEHNVINVLNLIICFQILVVLKTARKVTLVLDRLVSNVICCAKLALVNIIIVQNADLVVFYWTENAFSSAQADSFWTN